MKRIKIRVLALGFLAVATGAAVAYQEVIINGETWGCTNTCVVTTYPGGGWSIRDSRGGLIFRVNPA